MTKTNTQTKNVYNGCQKGRDVLIAHKYNGR